MSKKINLTKGDTFEGSQLTFLQDLPPIISDKGKVIRRALFKCECGNEKELNVSNVVRGSTKSCGCIHRGFKKTHGMTSHPLLSVWNSTFYRCYNTKCINYHQYGGRGIKVCDRWRDKRHGFNNFLEDMGEKPSEGFTLDRIDVDGDYEPSNCRWADSGEQSFNKRISSSNTTGYIGVSICGKYSNGDTKYVSYINYKNKRISLCKTRNLKEAVDKRIDAELKYYGYTIQENKE